MRSAPAPAAAPARPAIPPAPARRLEGIGLSPIRAMHEGAPPGCVALGLGEPTWELPAPARRALAAAAEAEGPCAYGPNAGLPALRSALAGLHGAATEEVMLAAGSQAALFALFQAWAGPGDAVLLPDPGFLAYPVLARLAGARPRPYALAADGGLDPAAFVAALDAEPEARLAVINHPANPTGAGADREALLAVDRACAARGVILVSDEAYRELHLGARPAGLRDAGGGGIVLSTASKAWGAPGLRVGWAVGDPALLAPARLVHNYMTSCLSRPSQLAALALIEASDIVLPAARLELKARWEALAEGLRQGLGAAPPAPVGGLYCWLPLPERGKADPLAFCLEVRDRGKAIVVPGLAFGEGGRGHARISFAARPEELLEGARRIAPFWRA